MVLGEIGQANTEQICRDFDDTLQLQRASQAPAKRWILEQGRVCERVQRGRFRDLWE